MNLWNKVPDFKSKPRGDGLCYRTACSKMYKKYIFAKSFFRIWRPEYSLYSIITSIIRKSWLCLTHSLYPFEKNVRLYPWTVPKCLIQHKTSIYSTEPPQVCVLNPSLFILLLLSLFKLFYSKLNTVRYAGWNKKLLWFQHHDQVHNFQSSLVVRQHFYSEKVCLRVGKNQEIFNLFLCKDRKIKSVY